MLHSLNLILTKLVENDFRGLHLHNLKSLLTISLCTTLAQPESNYIFTTWFQRLTPAQPKTFPDNIILHYTPTTWILLHSYISISEVYTSKLLNLCWRYHCTISLSLTQSDFHYIRTTWFQGSTLAKAKIFMFMVKWHILRYTAHPDFHLYSLNIISVACDSYCVSMFPYKYIICTYIYV